VFGEKAKLCGGDGDRQPEVTDADLSPVAKSNNFDASGIMYPIGQA